MCVEINDKIHKTINTCARALHFNIWKPYITKILRFRRLSQDFWKITVNVFNTHIKIVFFFFSYDTIFFQHLKPIVLSDNYNCFQFFLNGLLFLVYLLNILCVVEKTDPQWSLVENKTKKLTNKSSIENKLIKVLLSNTFFLYLNLSLISNQRLYFHLVKKPPKVNFCSIIHSFENGNVVKHDSTQPLFARSFDSQIYLSSPGVRLI